MTNRWNTTAALPASTVGRAPTHRARHSRRNCGDRSHNDHRSKHASGLPCPMPIGYRIDNTQGLTIGVWQGALTADDIAVATEELFANPAWPPPGRKHLTDLTTLRATPDLEQLAEMHRASGLARGIRLAVVASDHFDEARKYEQAVASAGLVVIVFTQVQSACSWLGVDYASAQAAIGELRRELRDRPGGSTRTTSSTAP